MRAFCYEYLIDGKPILAPDEDLKMEFSDLDSEESGRDESGYMHRIVLREGVKTWGLSYGSLTLEEYRYMEGLFNGKPQFIWTHRDIDGYPVKAAAYRSKHSIVIRSLKSQTVKNYNFNIIEC